MCDKGLPRDIKWTRDVLPTPESPRTKIRTRSRSIVILHNNEVSELFEKKCQQITRLVSLLTNKFNLLLQCICPFLSNKSRDSSDFTEKFGKNWFCFEFCQRHKWRENSNVLKALQFLKTHLMLSLAEKENFQWYFVKVNG